MKKIFMREKKNREAILRVILILIAVALNIKYIFVDFGIDAEFQISMAYRLAMGDEMFLEMWEPYQMSAFLCAFFVKIWMLLFGNTTGIVIYLQLIGVIIDAGMSFLLYFIIKKHIKEEKIGFAMAWIFFLLSPKDIPLADYTNMQMWFSLLLCIFLLLHYKTKRRRFIIGAALSLCGAVLSYPSCLILLFGVLAIFFYKKDLKSALLFAGICVFSGIIYLSFIFTKVSIGEFEEIIHNILAIETSHSMGIVERFLWYLKDLSKIVIVLSILYGVAYAFTRLLIIKEENDKVQRRAVVNILFLIFAIVIGLYSIIRWQDYIRYSYAIVFMAVIFAGWRMFLTVKMSEDKKYFYFCGTIVSLMQFLATLILTNLAFVASLPYLLIAVLVAFLPLEGMFRVIDHGKVVKGLKISLLSVAIFMVVFRGVYIIRPMSGDVSSILKIAAVVKSGPAIGIVSEYMGPYMQNETMKEWEQFVEEGQSIYLIGDSLDTLGYLYKDTEIAAPSLVPTPGYNETILEYWEQNPDKYPDVIVASCWYGEMQPFLEEDNWIMQWIEEEFQPAYYVDGKYWRYYFSEEK